MLSPERLPPIFGYAAGQRQGEPASAGAALCRVPGTTMGALTGIPLAVALGLLIDGAFDRHGVFTPEQIIDPDRYFAALAARCPGAPTAADMVAVTRSWDPGARDRFRAAMLDARASVELMRGAADGQAR